ncbi:MAG: DUF2178 domain-containing protein [Patescibacteria group bacterium]
MTIKQFTYAKIGVAVFVAIVVSQAVVLDNFVLACLGVALGFGLMFFLRRQVSGVLADERDYEIAGRAARLSFNIFTGLVGAIIMLLMFLRDVDPFNETIAVVLTYALCGQMLIYSLVFSYLNRLAVTGRRTGYIVAAIIIGFLLLTVSLRISSPEDSWLCENGAWVRHGQPAEPQPTTACQK